MAPKILVLRSGYCSERDFTSCFTSSLRLAPSMGQGFFTTGTPSVSAALRTLPSPT